ncbi:MAG: GTPase ObgE [Clostridiales bacterium]|nr:GTPase ObgE [Clostridiales bacterium]
MFIDEAKIYIKAGNGGNGTISFRREKYVANGGPDGGDGGNGGNIIFQADANARTLVDFKYKRKYVGENGENGSKRNRSGKSGEDIIIKVPMGTILKDFESLQPLCDLSKDLQEFVAVRGGKGGAGNQHFATPRRQAPNFAKSGEEGEEAEVILELKLLAEVGLLGFPNVGKSTLLSAVSSARPKIADYHFTTLHPNLGVVSIDAENEFVIADIPGLIEGASEGVGLGHEFLKHIERTKLLIHMVDASGCEGRNPIEDFDKINKELLQYSEKLATRPQIVAANKSDIADKEIMKTFLAEMKKRDYEVFEISGVTQKNVKQLMQRTYEIINELPDTILFEANEDYVNYEAIEEDKFVITKEDRVFIIEGKWAKKIVNSTNMDDFESLQYFQRTLRKSGVIAALEDYGIQEGDIVSIYEIEFEYIR